jgi:flagellum-specific peptidoglycan hydrolase FlgJ
MGREDFFTSMAPYAAKASSATGVPIPVILAQWGLESAYGTSEVYKNNNNLAGIKHVSSSIDSGISPSGYSKYNSLDQFVQDYVRVMSISYYDNVRQAGTVDGAVSALGASPWAETHYRDSSGQAGGNLMSVIEANELEKYSAAAPAGGHPYGFDASKIMQGVANMTPEELSIYAAVGACAMAAWWLLTKK